MRTENSDVSERHGFLRRARDQVRHSVFQWRRGYAPAGEALPIGELISPLRYDIVIRAQFLEHIAHHRDEVAADFDAFAAASMDHDYFAWFRTIAYPRFHARGAIDDAQLHGAFRERVAKTVRLLDAYERSGFDRRFPVSVRRATSPTRTLTGKLVERNYHLADGCHRLALLYLSGWDKLPPDYYRIRTDSVFAPVDNTHLLIPVTQLAPADYYAFVSQGYGDGTFTDRESLLEHVAAKSPDRLKELEKVLTIDEPLLAESDR